MVDMNKKRLLFLFPGVIHDPTLPNFKGQFELLSGRFEGAILTRTWGKGLVEYKIGDFDYFAFPNSMSRFKDRLALAKFIVKKAKEMHFKKAFDAIICYEPMSTGLIGVFLTLSMKCKLIVEINSEDYGGAIEAHHGKGFSNKCKDLFTKLVCNVALLRADAIKVLTDATKVKLPGRFRNKKVFVIQSYVPEDHLLDLQPVFDKFILFVGFPFHLKGTDLLIRAFQKLKADFPEFKLVLIGHKLEEEAGKSFHDMGQDIEFHPGVYFNDLKEFYRSCYCLVLPSRTEGMGRVLLEAMACGKPVVGSRVGGIPYIIEDGINGYLFEKDNSYDLTDKLRMLLNNPSLAKEMGDEGRRLMRDKFSSGFYHKEFTRMITSVLASEAGPL